MTLYEIKWEKRNKTWKRPNEIKLDENKKTKWEESKKEE